MGLKPRGSIMLHRCWILALTLTAACASPPLAPYQYHEGWEADGPVLKEWAKNGPSTVVFSGPTDEDAAEGKRSYKFEVELGGGSYHYFGVPLTVPCEGELTLTAKVKVGAGTTARVGFGTNMNYPPSTESGCGPAESWRGPTVGWETVTIDLVEKGKEGAASVMPRYTGSLTGDDVGAVLDRYSLFIYGGEGKRAVVYLDDVRITGRAPSMADYKAELAARWQAAKDRLTGQITGWRTELAAGREVLDGLGELPPELAPLAQRSREAADHAEQLLAEVGQRGYAKVSEMQDIRAAIGLARSAPSNLKALQAALQGGLPWVLYAPPAIRNDHPTPAQFPIPSEPATSVDLAACPGEFESATVIVYAAKPLSGLTISVSELQGPATLPAETVDISAVKCWYQAGRGIGDLSHKRLVPELLLKDTGLVKVDEDAGANYLRSTAEDGTNSYLLCSGKNSEDLADVRPRDGDTLLPVDLGQGRLQQYWLTLHLPDDCAAGAYRGTVKVQAGDAHRELPLNLTVHPFKLLTPKLIYSIYYRARLAPDGLPTITSERRSEEQYLAEMKDLLAHGVAYPTDYQGWDDEFLTRDLDLRREAGLPGGPYFSLGVGLGNTEDPAKLKELQANVKRWRERLKPYGYDEVYAYGFDEATGERLASQRQAWAAVQEAGGKTFVACYLKTFEAMGKLLDLAILAGPPKPEEVAKFHSVGSKVFCYANPQVGNEEPETYRRNFGLLLWRHDYDGAMDYAYQHGFGHVWNDFDSTHYRDHNFTYPTVNGIVDTIQWEGFREGVDDVRYVTTLEAAIKEKPGKVADGAQQWLDQLDPTTCDLDRTRAEIVTWLERLR